ncbi:MAG: hypothetical protein MJY61_01890 [Bacteroidales bacterium]|nr:hypothetical protein [Bacteroidales bacterium]
MKGKNMILIAFALAVVIPFTANAQAIVRDTTVKDITQYRDEMGFYQKANRDMGDPRFMFSDKRTGIDFGVGGVVKGVASYGFGGAVSTVAFNPWSLSVPTDKSPGFYGKLSDSYLYAKARAKLGKYKITAFLKIDGDDNNKIKLAEAYLSLNGFSLGMIPTFLTDLEYGVKSTGTALTSLVDKPHFLIGYTQRFKCGLSLAGSLELPTVDLDHYGQQSGIGTTYQPLPDIALKLKYNWTGGHLQFACMFRYLSYWSFEYPPEYDNVGINGHVPGYAIAFSGGVKLSPMFKISWDFIGGRGINSYLRSFQGMKLDLAINNSTDGVYKSMSAVPSVNAGISFEAAWSRKFCSSFVLFDSHVFDSPRYTLYDNFRNALGGLANFFWNFDDYAYCGIEYMFLNKRLYAANGAPDFGQAHRLAFVMAYCF